MLVLHRIIAKAKFQALMVVDLVFFICCVLLAKLWNLAMVSYKPRPLHLEKYLAS